MKNKDKQISLHFQKTDNEGNINFPGYLLYPAGEDIFSKSKEEGNIYPEDISKMKDSSDNSKAGKSSEKDFVEDQSGSDLDVPGSKLDNEEEIIGN